MNKLPLISIMFTFAVLFPDSISAKQTESIHAENKIPISVTRFVQESEKITDGCKDFYWGDQGQLRTMLERALSIQGLRVLERRDIRKIYEDEFELVNLNKKTQPKRKGFVSAKYSITGGITELGICESGSAEGLQLGGIIGLLGGPSDSVLSVAHKSVISKITVVGNILNVETGEILKSIEATGELTDEGTGVSAGTSGIGGSVGSGTKAPIERAARQAIDELAKQIGDALKAI